MSPEKDEKLCKDFPEIFKNRYASMQETCMCWGFECGDGWYDLIYTLCKDIQHHINNKLKNLSKKEQENIRVVADQVKEKYGGLRFYYSGGDEYIGGMVDFAESMSYNICEDCGNKAKNYNDGWVRTYCESCEEEWQRKRSASRA
jgi:hypothetical protein